MPSGVSLGSRGQGYELNILENGRKGGHFGGARGPLSLLLQAIYGPIVSIRNVSIFSFSLGFSENQRILELLWNLGNRVNPRIFHDVVD